MPPSLFPSVNRRSRSGVALVIVLAFVLLLTGLVVAFFSRALSDRQISNSGANQVKVDLLARGAVGTLVGDLQQEIAAGSTLYPLPSPTPAQGSATLFVPGYVSAGGTPPPNAATMVPAQALASPTPAPTNTATGLENLVKQSAGGIPFYPATNYNTSNYPPSTRAAKSTSGTGAAGDNSTAKPSISGRYISPARWNKPLLLPATSATDLTPVITGGSFVPPDWVLVARDGSNPTTWSTGLRTSATGSTSVIGRYAYNIYDEGGLLDANVAGYPAPSSTPAPTSAGRAGVYKNTLAYADLTQLTDAGGNQLLTQAQIDALVGWRNSASANAPGAFPNPAFTDPARDTYYKFMLSNPTGFLSVGNVSLYNKQSDRMFSGRQTLIDLMQSIVTLTGSDPTKPDPTQLAKANASLRYLGTFGRGLEQPSFFKAQSFRQTDAANNPYPGYNKDAPAVLPANQGGTNAYQLDSLINPSFLAVRVKTATAKARFDGSDLAVGEPLVKKRFPLNRLAWLTYVGPITLDGTNYNPKLDPSYVTTLKNTYGLSDAFLLQGTAANILYCFGLNWSSASPAHWIYMHNGSAGSGAIRKLDSPADTTDVLRATPAREADFFELLKASVNVGSLAKAATDPTQTSLPGGATGSYNLQSVDDGSVDSAIIQLGANIIDQYDLDGYATWINFNDGGSTAGRDIYGVENLPYLSRLTHALVKVKQANPTLRSVTINNVATQVITDTGVGALLQCPELWNPHDYQTSNLNQSSGIVGPTKFRVYATSGNAANVNSALVIRGVIRTGAGNGHDQKQADVPKSPGYNSMYNLSFTPPEIRTLTQANTELDFNVTRDSTGMARFREPTILCQTTSAGGYVTATPPTTGFGNISSNAGFFASGGFRSDVDSGVVGVPPVAGAGYVGFYLGAVPLYWSDSAATGHPYFWVDCAVVDTPTDVTYKLEYQDATGSWITYDKKYRTLGGSGSYSENATLSSGGDQSASTSGWSAFFYPRPSPAGNGQWDSSYAVMDPRTSRFHLMKFTADNARYWIYPPYSAPYSGDPTSIASRTATANAVGFTYGWISAGQGITLAERNGSNDGSSLFCPIGLFPTTMGWNPGSATVGNTGSFITYNSLILGPVSASGLHICRPGMFSQNNPYARRNDRSLGDTGDSPTMDSTFSPPGGQSNAAQSYRDPDGVIRRAMGGLVPYASGTGGPAATSDVGLPMTAANTTGVTRLSQSDSRPVILNHPFRTVGELAYTFSGTPWKNINFTMPESGDSALLDVFCISDTDDSNGLVAGKVNLNTRQAPVIKAIIAGAYKDENNPTAAPVSAALLDTVANGLVNRTTSTAAGKGPLQNVSDLVGRFVSKVDAKTDTAISGVADANKTTTYSPQSYNGFSADLIDNVPRSAGASVPTGILLTDPNINIPRFANATVRALAANGQTRVWNLMIDVIAQTGRYPGTASSLDKFAVEGEQRYWVHLSIDRLTGQVIDKQLEVVKE